MFTIFGVYVEGSTIHTYNTVKPVRAEDESEQDIRLMRAPIAKYPLMIQI